jgi:hypothetical protein
MIVFRRPFRPHLPVDLAEVLMPAAGDRLERPGRLAPVLVKIWCGERRTPGLVGKWVDDKTLVTDLATLPTLLSRLRSNLRRDIRRALNEDGVVREVGWTVEQIVEFHRDHDGSNPNRPSPFTLGRLHDAGRLSISVAMVEGEALVVHANVEDFPRVRILQSYSKRKQADSPERYALIGRANRALHYQDMAAYHEAGYTEYDWGGYSGVPGNGIDIFKASFLGELKDQVHFRGVLLPAAPAVEF